MVLKHVQQRAMLFGSRLSRNLLILMCHSMLIDEVFIAVLV